MLVVYHVSSTSGSNWDIVLYTLLDTVVTRRILANAGGQPTHTFHEQSAGQLKCKRRRSTAEREHRNSHQVKHLENIFLWHIGGLLFHPFISFP